MLKTVSIALAAAAMLASVGVAAQERDTRTAGVVYRDLDLATVEGRAELDRRIDNAAKEACGVRERQVGSNIMTRESRECYRNAKRDLERHFAQMIDNRSRAG